MIDAPASCPCCAVAFRGEPILQELRAPHHPDEAPLFRVLALYDADPGRVVLWECADCGHRWPRE